MSDPEQKRKIIGREFIRSFEQAERKLIEEAGEEGAQIKFLVQGTCTGCGRIRWWRGRSKY